LIGGLNVRKTLLFIAIVSLVSAAPALSSGDIAREHRKDNARADANEIIEMRSTLAKEFIKPEVEITEDVFKNVCGSVAKRVKEMTEKEGIAIRHAAVKNRNPKNAATPEEAALIGKFESDRKFTEAQETFEKDGRKFFRYTKPIFVEQACLACHGEKDKRPKFIVEKYTDDRAFDFKKGDLRGIISITTPLD
jgi:hypothetical protein